MVILESLGMQMLEAQYHRVHSMVGLQSIIDITLDCLKGLFGFASSSPTGTTELLLLVLMVLFYTIVWIQIVVVLLVK